MNPRPTRTVYLVDDNAEFRSSAQWWLSGAGYDVHDYADAESAFDALQLMAAETPQHLHRACLLLDVRMPGLSGLDLHDRLADCGLASRGAAADSASGNESHHSRPQMPVVYMTGHGDVPLAVAAMQKGAVTMLEKPFADDALERALERAFAAAESTWARAQLAAAFDTEVVETAPAAEPAGPDLDEVARLEYRRRVKSLTQRQQQVMDGIVVGKLSKQIAYETGLSSKTVEFHRKGVMDRMGARNAIELVRMAVSGSVATAMRSLVQQAA